MILVIFNLPYNYFGFEGWSLVLIVLVPSHCLHLTYNSTEIHTYIKVCFKLMAALWQTLSIVNYMEMTKVAFSRPCIVLRMSMENTEKFNIFFYCARTHNVYDYESKVCYHLITLFQVNFHVLKSHCSSTHSVSMYVVISPTGLLALFIHILLILFYHFSINLKHTV